MMSVNDRQQWYGYELAYLLAEHSNVVQDEESTQLHFGSKIYIFEKPIEFEKYIKLLNVKGCVNMIYIFYRMLVDGLLL